MSYPLNRIFVKANFSSLNKISLCVILEGFCLFVCFVLTNNELVGKGISSDTLFAS